MDHIQQAIYAKNNSTTPRFGTVTELQKNITDMDHFPYTRFYRGRVGDPNPVIIDREFGWHPTENCYTKPSGYAKIDDNCKVPSAYPNHCFQGACTVTYPCHPKGLSSRAREIAINGHCIVQYR
jgi:hypothetical protein